MEATFPMIQNRIYKKKKKNSWGFWYIWLCIWTRPCWYMKSRFGFYVVQSLTDINLTAYIHRRQLIIFFSLKVILPIVPCEMKDWFWEDSMGRAGDIDVPVLCGVVPQLRTRARIWINAIDVCQYVNTPIYLHKKQWHVTLAFQKLAEGTNPSSKVLTTKYVETKYAGIFGGPRIPICKYSYTSVREQWHVHWL